MLRTVDAGNRYELVRALDNPVFREDAKNTLVKIGQASVEPLLERLDAEKVQNRIAIVATLGRLGPAGSAAWPRLLQLTKDKDRDLVAEVSKAFMLNGSAVVPVLAAGLKDADPTLRVNSARLLAELKQQAEPAVPALKAALNDPQRTVLLRFWCVAALAEIGPAAEPATPELLRALSEMDVKDRYLPAKALGRIGPPARAAIPQLLDLLRNRKSIHNAETAAQALVGIGSDAVPALMSLLRGQTRERKLQEVAAESLVRIGQGAVPHLLRALTDAEQALVDRAAFVLVQIGEPAVADLMNLMRETSDPTLKFVVAQILARIPSAAPMAVPGLVAGLQNPSALERVAAARALAAVGPAAVEAVPALLEALKADLEVAARRHGPEFPQTYVSEVGGALVAAGEKAITPLHRALIDPHPVVQSVAAQALANLGQVYQREIVARMVSSLMTPHPQLNDRALEVLAGIRPTAFMLARLGPKAIPGLTEAVKRGPTGLRVSAAHALAMQGPPAVIALVECLVAQDLTVRLTAVQALGAMKGNAAAAVPALVHALRSLPEDMAAAPEIKPAVWQEYAVTIAFSLGDIGPPAVEKAVELLTEEDVELRAAGATALARMGPRAVSAVDSLRNCLLGDDIEVRQAALHALNRIGPPALAAVPDILQLLRDSDQVYLQDPEREKLQGLYRRNLADTLVRMGSAALPTLIPLLQDENLVLRTHVGFAVQKIKINPTLAGELTPEMEPVLLAALADKSLAVRVAAAKVLFRLEPAIPGAVEPLLKAVRTADVVLGDKQFKDDLAANYLTFIVGALDHIGEPAVAPLIQAAKEENEALRGVAAWALSRLAPDASQLIDLGEESLPLLVSATRDFHSAFGKQAIETLVELGDVAVRPLLEAAATGGPGQVLGAQRTLAQMYERSALTLIENMKDPNPAIRAAAARALGGPKPAGPKSIPVSDSLTALEAALKDEDADVRNSAAHSLRWLDPRLAEQLGVHETRSLKAILDEINGVILPEAVPAAPAPPKKSLPEAAAAPASRTFTGQP